ncbi:glycosyltransferase family 4 protein [Nitrosospira sp. NpAV]|uniref:glycosyltransferase n=1 Tax=Nitrosospira sp. NpAV TaxID=58133 RepID=UPI0018DCF868|nr:glycosyltransferase family 4 protein [Nitrosospira sp. NpAV]
MNIKERSRKRILFISPVTPKSGGIGIEVRAWSHLEALATVADVDLALAMTPDQVARASVEEIQPLCSSVTFIKLRPSGKMAKRRVTGLTALNRAVNVHSSSFQLDTKDMTSLCERLRNMHIDIVFCFRIASYDVFEHFPKTSIWQHSRLFVDFDDIESLSIRRELPFAKRILGFESALIVRIAGIEASILESRIQRKADMISVCSEVDRQRLVSRGGRATVVIVPNSFTRMPALPLRPIGTVAKLLFLGTMSYSPNEDAILYFCREIYPHIRKRYRRDIRLTIVGRRPSAKVLALAEDASIVVTGGVDSVEPYYDEADLVVAPIRFGGGTRVKILEALSFGRAVVSTTLGAEGLELMRGRDLELADEPEDFAGICVALLENQGMRFDLARSGRERVGAVYERKQIQHALAKRILDL